MNLRSGYLGNGPIRIRHSRPTISDRDIASVKQTLRSGYLGNGPTCQRFEKSLARFIGVTHSAAVSSGTAALHLALLALDIGPGDEVIIPSFVCTAVLNAVNFTDAKVKLADINLEDFNLRFDDVTKRLSKKTKALILPHMFGKPADIRNFLKLKIPVIENCAHSVGAKLYGKRVGSFGTLSMFSFYATKMLTTGYGGMVCSNNSVYIKKIKDLIDVDERQDYKVRYNYKMSDICAALGLSQLSKLNSFIAKRKVLASIYDEILSKSNNIILPSGEDHIYFRYVIRVKGDIKKIINRLSRKGIETKRPVFKPLHRYLGLKRCDYPNAEEAYNSTISLPIYPSFNERQARLIAKATLKAVELN
ncbi:MAG: hypothetical protein AMJ78_08895 [Omnitrophica WOR_2 bacterium SM23_29]|nr:MAG: hypothetical protein AMJ78_08895 [Omnitrophica WOR_2 bacterium SM23_29]